MLGFVCFALTTVTMLALCKKHTCQRNGREQQSREWAYTTARRTDHQLLIRSQNFPCCSLQSCFSLSWQMIWYYSHFSINTITVFPYCSTLFTSVVRWNPLFPNKHLLPNECGYCYVFSEGLEFYLIYVAGVLASWNYDILPYLVNNRDWSLASPGSMTPWQLFLRVYSLDTIPARVLLALQTAVSC